MPLGTLRSSMTTTRATRQTSTTAAAAAVMGKKRKAVEDSSSTKVNGPSSKASRRRAAFGDLTNAYAEEQSFTKPTLKSQVKKGLTNIRSLTSFNKQTSASKKIKKENKKTGRTVTNGIIKSVLNEEEEDTSALDEEDLGITLSQGSLPTSSQEDFKSVGELILSDEDDDEYESAEEDCSEGGKTPWKIPPKGVIDFDYENGTDPFQCSVYAMDIFEYYKSREAKFRVDDYMSNGKQKEITVAMRAILVDWLVEVQESFELNHETLYTAVKIMDLYLSLETKTIRKEDLQLIGATACLIACKIDERIPPLLDDFVYVCDNAYTREQIITMERTIIKTVDYDVGYPLSYRFLRRYGRVCKVTMPVLTLARYILELSLVEYQLNVGTSESKLAAAALVLAFKIRGIEGWGETLKFYSGYSAARDLSDLVQRLLQLLKKSGNGNVKTIKVKYSHRVFHEVALLEIPEEVVMTELNI